MDREPLIEQIGIEATNQIMEMQLKIKRLEEYLQIFPDYTTTSLHYKPIPKQMTTETLKKIARETVLRFRGNLSDPETFEFLYENVLAALETVNASNLKRSDSNTAKTQTLNPKENTQ